MLKKLIMLSVLLTVTFALLGTTPWIVKGDFSLLINQSYYSDNWTGDEESAIDWVEKQAIGKASIMSFCGSTTGFVSILFTSYSIFSCIRISTI